MIYALIPLLLLLAVWVGAVYRRLRQLDDNIKIAMEQIGLQLSSRFRALETLLELLRSYGPSAQLVLPPPSIHALSTPAQVLEEMELFLTHVDSEGTVFRSNHASNYISLAGNLNRDIPAMLEKIQKSRERDAFKNESMRRL